MSDESMGTLEQASSSSRESGASTRACPHCSTRSETAGPYCPNCGRRFDRRPLPRPRRRVLYLAVGLLLIAGAFVGAIVKHNDDQNAKNRRASARILREVEASELEAHKVDQKRVEGYVLTDARNLARVGVLRGPFIGSSCWPPGGVPHAADRSIVGYDCIVIKRWRGQTPEGVRFFGQVEYHNRRRATFAGG